MYRFEFYVKSEEGIEGTVIDFGNDNINVTERDHLSDSEHCALVNAAATSLFYKWDQKPEFNEETRFLSGGLRNLIDPQNLFNCYIFEQSKPETPFELVLATIIEAQNA